MTTPDPLEPAFEAAKAAVRHDLDLHRRVDGSVADFEIEAAIRAADPIIAAQAARKALGGAAVELRTLAAQLGAGWDLEPDPTPTYVAYGQAFKEAARRINEVGERLWKRAEETDAT